MKKNKHWSGKKVVVTGSSGFIGQAIVSLLKKMSATVVSISRREGIDVLDIHKLENETKNADVIINCAALDGNGEFKKENSHLILDTNIKIASNVLNVAVKNNIKNIAFLSSAEIYPSNIKSPFSEVDDYVNNPEYVENGYVLSKRITEILASQFAKKYNLQVLLVRPTNVYGPNDLNKRVISTLIENINKGENINIWGDGLQKRSFIYVDDFAEVLLSLIANNVTGKINIASSESISILKLAKLIAEIMNKELNVTFDKTKDGQVDRVLNIEKLESLLDFNFIKLRDGLLKIISSFGEK